MSNRLCSFFLLLGSKSKKCHLKGTIDNHNNCDCCSKTKDKLGGIVNDIRDIIESNISFSYLISTYSSEKSGVSRKNMFRKKRCKNGKYYIECIFHMNMSLLSTKNNIWLDCIYFFIQSKFFD